MTYSSEELRSQEEVDYLSFNDPRGYTHRYNNKRIADTSNNHQDSIESQEQRSRWIIDLSVLGKFLQQHVRVLDALGGFDQPFCGCVQGQVHIGIQPLEQEKC